MQSKWAALKTTHTAMDKLFHKYQDLKLDFDMCRTKLNEAMPLIRDGRVTMSEAFILAKPDSDNAKHQIKLLTGVGAHAFDMHPAIYQKVQSLLKK